MARVMDAASGVQLDALGPGTLLSVPDVCRGHRWDMIRRFTFGGSCSIAVLCLIASLCATATADVEQSSHVVFVGLRPIKRKGGPSDLRRLAEAQQLRVIAESTLALSSRVPVLGHEAVKRVLGNNYLAR